VPPLGNKHGPVEAKTVKDCSGRYEELECFVQREAAGARQQAGLVPPLGIKHGPVEAIQPTAQYSGSRQRCMRAKPCKQGSGVSACFPARVLLLLHSPAARHKADSNMASKHQHKTMAAAQPQLCCSSKPCG
jgi:hypothetical protein